MAISTESRPTLRGKLLTVGIMGTAIDCGNRGVLALGSSLVSLFSSVTSDATLVLFIGHKDNKTVCFRSQEGIQTAAVVNARMSHRSALRDHFLWIILMAICYRVIPSKRTRALIANSTPWVSSLLKVDIIGDIRGGDSFSDIYGFRRFCTGWLMEWTVLLVRGSIIQLPQTYGPFKSPLTRLLAAYLLRRSSLIVARDIQSQRIAQKLVGAKLQVLLSPDVAFSLAPMVPPRMEFSPPIPGDLPQGVIGLNINGLMYHGGYTRKNMFELTWDYPLVLREAIMCLLQEGSGEIWLIPHTWAPAGNVESDDTASVELLASLPETFRSRIRLLVGEYDCHEVKAIIGRCDFFIGSRMHACIAALSQGVPCVGLAYSMKFSGVFNTVGVQDWVIDGRSATTGQTVSRILALYRQREILRVDLMRRAAEARAQLTKVFETIVTHVPPRL